jgi:pimeloyl-ACP methyl ester carboxylesterase
VLYNDLKACNDYAAGLESAAKVQCPVLFILGRQDAMTPNKGGLGFSKIFKNQNTVVANSGHSLMAEAPDATLDALVGFFSKHG